MIFCGDSRINTFLTGRYPKLSVAMKICKSETFHLRESYQMHLRYFGLDFRTTIGLKSERTTSDWHDRRYSYSLFAIRGMLSTLLRSGDDPVGGGTGAFRLGFGRTPVRDVS